MPEAPQEDIAYFKREKADARDPPLSLGDYLTTGPRVRHTKAQQLEEARRRFLRDNR